MTREMFINAVNDIQLPQYVIADHVEYPAPDEAEDYEGTNLKAWKVQPKRYRKGYCPTICKSRRAAELEQERLERITGFEWAIKVMME